MRHPGHDRRRGGHRPLALRRGCDRMSDRWAAAIQRAAGRLGPGRRRLSAKRAVDRLLAGVLLIWALFDVPWWWRVAGACAGGNPGHPGDGRAGGGPVSTFPVAAQCSPVTLALAGAALAVKFAGHDNIWSASASVLAAAYGLGAYGTPLMRRAARLLAAVALAVGPSWLPWRPAAGRPRRPFGGRGLRPAHHGAGPGARSPAPTGISTTAAPSTLTTWTEWRPGSGAARYPRPPAQRHRPVRRPGAARLASEGRSRSLPRARDRGHRAGSPPPGSASSTNWSAACGRPSPRTAAHRVRAAGSPS